MIIPLPEPNAQNEATIRFSKSHLLNPSNAALFALTCPKLMSASDQTAEKLIPVKANFTGYLREGLEIVQATCKPAGVQVRGAKTIIDSLERIETNPIILDRRSASFMETVGLALSDTPSISADTQRIDVRIEIKEQIRTRQFLNIPLRVLNAPNNGFSIALAPETINLTRRPAKSGSIRPENITAYVRCDQLDASTTYDLPVQVDLPDGVIFEQYRAKRGQSIHKFNTIDTYMKKYMLLLAFVAFADCNAQTNAISVTTASDASRCSRTLEISILQMVILKMH